MYESAIQRKIILSLQKSNWIVVKIIQCQLNGFPDLICLKNSRTVFIEVKQPGKKPAELQEYRIKKLKEQGFEVIIARDPNDIAHLQTY